MEKVDLKKELKYLYNPSKKEVGIINVPEFQFLMIDGIDARPESDLFQEAIQALFAVSFKAKFLAKKKLQYDYVVMPLEGLWWADDMNDFVIGNKEHWKWTLMIMQPEVIIQGIINEAITDSKEKVSKEVLNLLRLENFEEGRSSQIMHIGPFSEEQANILRVHDQIHAEKGTFNGQKQKHHEIYLSDFRKTPPEKLRTIIRQSFTI